MGLLRASRWLLMSFLVGAGSSLGGYEVSNSGERGLSLALLSARRWGKRPEEPIGLECHETRGLTRGCGSVTPFKPNSQAVGAHTPPLHMRCRIPSPGKPTSQKRTWNHVEPTIRLGETNKRDLQNPIHDIEQLAA